MVDYKGNVGGGVARSSFPHGSEVVGEPSMVPFCKDCRWHRRPALSDLELARCQRTLKALPPSPVTGEHPSRANYCSDERAAGSWLTRLYGNDDRCGPEGRFFEERQLPPPPTGGSAMPSRPTR